MNRNTFSWMPFSQLCANRRWHRRTAGTVLSLVLGILGVAIVIHLFGAGSTLVHADDALSLNALPGWFSNDMNSSYSVAWGDVDGDGDLDLAVGNNGEIGCSGSCFLGEPNKVYLNENGVLQTSDIWVSDESDATWSVAWGDVDGDGDLDLAAGNTDNPNRVYLNEGGVLKTTASWTDAISDSTTSVAWADVNGDGYLDLAVGNGGYGAAAAPNKLYLNLGGVLDTTSSWSDNVSENTWGLAWGDVDGDGDLDLAVANRSQQNKIYINNNGSLAGAAAWTSDDSSASHGIAWGDVDGDGDLDLAVGNRFQPDRVYLNQGTSLETGASWVSAGSETTHGVAWGDMDGDGDLDLAIATETEQRIYLNRNGALLRTAAWTSAERDLGYGVAWGDVDGDGDLDLAYAIDGVNKVYLNARAPLQTTAWTSDDTSATWSVAWADVDGDGDLDLAAGNRGAANSVYINENGRLQSAAAWTDGNSDSTWEIAWGDVDGDGDLDLAVANIEGANKVYFNESGMLTTVGAWVSADSDNTISVAWGDVDGDGDLDLAVGNAGPYDTTYRTCRGGAVNKIYLNQGGSLETTAGWVSDDSVDTVSIAWGDVDGDGDLDLATGNGTLFGDANRLYLNQEGRLQSTATWASDDSDWTESIAWGDMDGDGDLDLAAGNWAAPNKVYLNRDGTLETAATWRSSAGDWTMGVAWGDVDGDGDLDLAVANADIRSNAVPNTVYLNEKGVLQTLAAWSSQDAEVTTFAAWGDVNGDGSLDLAVGNSGAPNKVYLNQRPMHPHRPGQAASLALALESDPVQTFSQETTALAPVNFYGVPGIRESGTIPITYTLFNPSGEPMQSLNAFFSPDGGGRWYTATATSETATTGLTTGRGETFAASAGLPAPIPDPGSMSANLAIAESYAIADLDVWLVISHTWIEDLDISLRSPDGTVVNLVMNRGGDGDDLNHTWFSDQAAVHISAGTAPFTGTYQPEGQLAQFNGEGTDGTWQLTITDGVSPDSGTLYAWGLRVKTVSDPHVYAWDVFGSGFFGQSDNVVFRLQACDLPSASSASGTYLYTDAIPGPYQRPCVAAQSFPFRVRGTQVRVLEGTAPISNALVYRLPAGQSVDGLPIADSAGRPFHTDTQGYLQGRGEIRAGDRLFAMVPVSWTDSYTLYHTSGTPTATGVDAYTVPAGSQGVHTLAVSENNPLYLFNLDVSLEWDASQDLAYLEQLEFSLQRASEYLYDFSNGQMALGRVRVFQNADDWAYVHVLIRSSNRLRPFAAQGGIVLSDTVDREHADIVYNPGQVVIGATWNRYGRPGQSLGEDWPLILAHELSHYLLYQDDTYLGLDDNGHLIAVDSCYGSAMGDLYNDPAASEFIFDDSHWQQNCGDTLPARTLQRDEWQTIQLWYPEVVVPTQLLSGPTLMPFELTTIQVFDPLTPTATLVDPTFYLNYTGGGGSSAEARAYLLRDDQYVFDLGSPFGGQNRVLAYGAQAGDRLCVFDRPFNQYGCEVIEAGDDQLHMEYDATWNPVIQITPVDSSTLTIRVEGIPGGLALRVRLYPEFGLASNQVSLSPSGDAYQGTFSLDYPAMAGHVQLWVDETATETDPRREAIVVYTIGGNPGMLRASGGMLRASGGMLRASGAPLVSPDGQMIFFTENPIVFDEGEFYTIQGMAGLPSVPPGRTVIGQGYSLVATAGTPVVDSSVSFQYLSNDVLVAGADEEGLTIYFYDGSTWQELPTVRDPYFNLATAPSQGQGIYALMSSVQVPLYAEGWNLFAYPLQQTQAVSDALRSIDGDYATVYGYVAQDGNDPWKVYHVDGPGYLNDLHNLEFGRGYWISATGAVTIHLGIASAAVEPQSSLPASPPDTYYGPVQGSATFTPLAGMVVEARVGGTLCGRGVTQDDGGSIVYVVDVEADDGTGRYAGCGRLGERITFFVDGQAMSPAGAWDNRQLDELSLTPMAIYLPIIMCQKGPDVNWPLGMP